MNLMEIYNTIRGVILRAVVKALDDTGPEQRVAVVLHAGQERSGVPVHYPFGFSSSVPLDGAVTHVFQNGADPADLFALPPSNPSVARMGELKEGETIQYDAAGQRVYLRNGQIIAVDAVQNMIVTIGGKPVFTVDAHGVQVNGKMIATDDVIGGGISLKNHTHGGVKPGGSNTSKPE